MSTPTATPMTTRIPRSTLTGDPCPHGPGKWCMECVGEGGFRYQQWAPATEEPTEGGAE